MGMAERDGLVELSKTNVLVVGMLRVFELTRGA